MTPEVKKALHEGYTYEEIASELARQRGVDLTKAYNEGFSAQEIVDHFAPTRHPLGAGLEAAASALGTALPYALEKQFGTVTPEEEASYGQRLRDSAAKQEQLLPGGPIDLGPALKRGLPGAGQFLAEQLGVSAPQMGATILGGMVGAGLGSLPGGIAGMTAVGTPFFVGTNTQRATNEGQQALTKEAAGRSLLTAPLQAATDAVGQVFLPGIGRWVGRPAAKLVEGEVEKLVPKVVKGMFKVALEEAITEPLQQVGERYAAGLPVDNAEAGKEYTKASLYAGILGATIGGAAAPFESKQQTPEQKKAQKELDTTAAAVVADPTAANEDALREKVVKHGMPAGMADTIVNHQIAKGTVPDVGTPVESGRVEPSVPTDGGVPAGGNLTPSASPATPGLASTGESAGVNNGGPPQVSSPLAEPVIPPAPVQAGPGAARAAARQTPPAVDAASEPRPTGVDTWDRENRNNRSDELFAGAATTIKAFDAVVDVAQQFQAHGMAKAATLGQAYDDLTGILSNGLDPTRGGGRLDTAPLHNRPGGGLVGATAGGHAYRDGAFIIVARPGTTEIRGPADIGGVLVNDAVAGTGVVEALQRQFPGLAVQNYSNVGGFLNQLTASSSQAEIVAKAPPELLQTHQSTTPAAAAAAEPAVDSQAVDAARIIASKKVAEEPVALTPAQEKQRYTPEKVRALIEQGNGVIPPAALARATELAGTPGTDLDKLGRLLEDMLTSSTQKAWQVAPIQEAPTPEMVAPVTAVTPPEVQEAPVEAPTGAAPVEATVEAPVEAPVGAAPVGAAPVEAPVPDTTQQRADPAARERTARNQAYAQKILRARATLGDAPLAVKSGNKIVKEEGGGTLHEVTLNDGTTVQMYRDTDQFGPSNPHWYVDDPLAPVNGGVESSIGTTKKEALERVAKQVQRDREAFLKSTGVPIPKPSAPERVATEVVHDKLTKVEKQTLARHYGEESYNAAAKSRFVEDVVTAINRGLGAVDVAIRHIIKRVQALVLAAAVVINPAGFKPINFDLPAVMRTVEVSEPQATVPTAANSNMSPMAKAVYGAMAPVAEKQGRGFFIADKPNGTIHAFDAKGEYILTSKALYGLTPGDTMSASRRAASSDQIGADNRVTPAGSYHLVISETEAAEGYPGNHVFFLLDDANHLIGDHVAIAVHGVWTVHPSENRVGRLNTDTVSDNKISSGCINTAEKAFLDEILPRGAEFDGGMIFVLPDDTAKTNEYFKPETTTKTFETPRAHQAAQDSENPMLPPREKRRATLQAHRRTRKGPGTSKDGETTPVEPAPEPVAQEAGGAPPVPPTPPAPPTAATPEPSEPETVQAAVEEIVKARNDNAANIQAAMDATRKGEQGAPRAVIDAIGGAIKSGDPKILKDLLGSTNRGMLFRLIKASPISPLFDYLNSRLSPAKMKPTEGDTPIQIKEHIGAVKRLEVLFNAVHGTTAQMREAAAGLGKRLTEFQHKFGQDAFARVDIMARLGRIKIAAWAPGTTVAEALAADAPTQLYENWIASAGPNTKPSQLQKWKDGLTQRKQDIAQAIGFWNALGEQEGGQELYTELRQYYIDMYDAIMALRKDRLSKLGLSDAQTQEILAAAEKDQQKVDPDDIHSEVPHHLFPKEYTPFMRSGEFWVTVKKAIDGKDMFVPFESIALRDQFIEEYAEKHKLDPKNPKHFDTGSGLAALQKHFNNEYEVFRAIAKTIDSAKKAGDVDLDALSDNLYQMALTLLPEQSVRKQELHSKNVPGYSTNVIQSYERMSSRYINQIVKLYYQPRMELAIKAVRDVIPEDASNVDKEKYTTVINELAERGRAMFDAPDQNALVSHLNRAAFVMFLTSGATAAAQFAGLPIMVAPRLWSRYGVGATIKTLAKYSQLWKTDGMWRTGADGTKRFIGPSLENSPMVQNVPVNKRAFAWGIEHGTFGTITASIMHNPTTGMDPHAGISNPIGKLVDMVGQPFNAAERMSREIAFMSAFDLHYAKTKDFEASTAEAMTVIRDTLTNPADFERAPLLKGDVGRTVGLFKSYPINIARFFLQNGYNVVRGETKEVKLQAFNNLVGTLLMGWLFHGMVGMPAWTFATAAIDQILDKILSDEDKEERRRRSPMGAMSSDFFFRYEWLPQNFGAISLPGLDGNEHTLKDMLMNGPVSELLVNVGPRTSFNGMIWRDGSPSDSTSGQIINNIVANIAGVSLLSNYGNAIDDFKNGEVLRGVEKMLPAAFKGLATAYRLRDEGAETYRGDELVNKEDINLPSLVQQAIGFSPPEVASIQKRNAMWKKLVQKVKTERNGLLQAYKDEFFDTRDPEKLSKIWDKMLEFSQRYPSPEFIISGETVWDSLKASGRSRRNTVQGIEITRNNAPETMRLTGLRQPGYARGDSVMVIPGNIDLHNRPVVHNPDGRISTVLTKTFEFDGVHYNLPTVVGGKIVSDKEAVDNFRKTGEHLGAYRSRAAAEAAAQSLHEDQAVEYLGK